MANKGKSGRPKGRIVDPLPVATVPLNEAARVLGIGSSTAYRLCQAGEFPVPAHKIGGTWKVLRADLERFAQGGIAV